ncbi:MAG: F0F1 ATP synthase subunit B [Lachnospiraceae bacterium]|nr:F0F1 ATP synthase subunit B [Lachnospiraceae bacterium]
MLSLDWNLVFTIINVLIFYLLIKKFLFKPINKIVAEREKMINDQFTEAENKVKEAEELKAKYQESLNHAEEEGEAMMKESRGKAQDEYNDIIKAAHDRSTDILKRADEAAKEQKEKAVREVQNQIAELAIAAAAQVASMQTSSQKDGAVYDEFLSKVGENSDRAGK